MLQFKPGDALLIVDIQNDFLPGGSLGVPEGDQVIPLLNADIKGAVTAGIPIIASRDWHPANHISFIAQGGVWPTHCVQNTSGATFNKALHLPTTTIIINKAFKPDLESYTAWNGQSHLDGRTLPEILTELGVKRLIIGGLALDYCVKETALDAIHHGLSVLVHLDATRAITSEAGQAAIDEMNTAGVSFFGNYQPPQLRKNLSPK
ncbi:MAG: nicotinamidase [Pseudomonadota bacterium]|nr:nicotinamidase [Pseudomonadota bacterium]